MARRIKTPKVKVVKLEVVQREACANDALAVEAYKHIDELVERYHPMLAKARLCLAWRRGEKLGPDGHLHLGKAGKCADLHRQLHEYDWVIILNRDAFGTFTPAQRKALVDHELCHCRPACTKDGTQKRDAQDKALWRVRKHDVEEFAEVVQRHGLWKSDLEAFYQAAVSNAKAPLLDAAPKGKGKNKGDAA